MDAAQPWMHFRDEASQPTIVNDGYPFVSSAHEMFTWPNAQSGYNPGLPSNNLDLGPAAGMPMECSMFGHGQSAHLADSQGDINDFNLTAHQVDEFDTVMEDLTFAAAAPVAAVTRASDAFTCGRQIDASAYHSGASGITLPDESISCPAMTFQAPPLAGAFPSESVMPCPGTAQQVITECAAAWSNDMIPVPPLSMQQDSWLSAQPLNYRDPAQVSTSRSFPITPTLSPLIAQSSAWTHHCQPASSVQAHVPAAKPNTTQRSTQPVTHSDASEPGQLLQPQAVQTLKRVRSSSGFTNTRAKSRKRSTKAIPGYEEFALDLVAVRPERNSRYGRPLDPGELAVRQRGACVRCRHFRKKVRSSSRES